MQAFLEKNVLFFAKKIMKKTEKGVFPVKKRFSMLH